MLKAKKSGSVLRHEKALKALSKVDKVNFTTRLEPKNVMHLKLMSAHSGKSMGDLVDRMIERESKTFFAKKNITA